jgi:hypothetical protein
MSAIPEAAEEAVGLPTEEGIAPEQPVQKEFDPRHREKFKGLMYLGALTEEFEWLGHTFVIRTLTTDELLAVALLIKDWTGTVAETKSYATAVVSLALVSIDDEPLPTPVVVEKDRYGWAFQRFNYVKATLLPYTIDAVYDRFLTLDQEAERILEEMGKAFGSTTDSSGSTPGLSASSG